MELEHRFEVPVGIEAAWTHLLDMEKVAACFPGATLTSADGQEYTGTVKVKLGPIQLTYAGSARIVSADEATHTATIEASGSAARSGSTAAMTVNATATSLGDDRTAVEMKTELTITGRPAQFGRGVMVEVGNKILGRFADCLSSKLAAANDDADSAETSPTDDVSPGPGSTPDGDAAKATAAESNSGSDAGSKPDAETGAASDAPAHARASASGDAAGHGPTTFTRAPVADSVPPIDLLESARGSIIKRVVPLVVGLVVLLLVRQIFRRRK